MPYANQHSFRVADPGKFAKDSFRSKDLGTGIRVILGKREGSSTMTVQAYRFDSSDFSFEEAKNWMKSHDKTYSEETEASGKSNLKEVDPVDVAFDDGPISICHDCNKCGTDCPHNDDEAKKVFDEGIQEDSIHTNAFIKVPKVNKFTLDTVEMTGVEVFAKGNWKGRNFTDSDLQDAVQNFRKGILGTEPFITIDHSEEATKQWGDALKASALGFVKNLYKVGDKLVADFYKVPKTLAELIQSGALKNKSIELWPSFDAPDGNTYHNVLEAVTFTGKVPAVVGLSDFVALYKRDTEVSNTQRGEKISYSMEEIMPTEISIKEDEYKSLMRFKMDHEIHKETVEKLNFKLSEQSKEIEKITAENAVLVKFKNESIEKTVQAEKSEAEGFVTRQINKGRIMPKSKDMYLEMYTMARSKGPESLQMFKDDILIRDSIVNLGEIGGDTEDPTPSRIDFKKKVSYEDANEVVSKHMKKTGKSFGDAAKELGILPSGDTDEDQKKSMEKYEEEKKSMKKGKFEEEEEEKKGKFEEDEDEEDEEKKKMEEEEDEDEESKVEEKRAKKLKAKRGKK